MRNGLGRRDRLELALHKARGDILCLSGDFLRSSAGKDERFEQRIRCKAVVSVDAGMCALAAGIEPVHAGLRIGIDVNAAHEVMLAGIDRHRLFCEVIALLQQFIIDFREPRPDLLRILMRNVNPEVLRACALAFEDDCVRHNVTRCELKAVVIALHKALHIAVSQVRALAADGL